MGKFLKGATIGTLIGAAAGMLIIPELDRDTKRRIKKSSRFMKSAAEDVYYNMKNWTK